MRLRTKLAAVTFAAVSALALSAAKPPAPATFDPEIAYTYASGNYMDLRLANRQGTAAILVYRTAFGALSTFDLAPESATAPNGPNRISIADSSRRQLFVRTWTKNPVAVSPNEQLIYSGLVDTSDFSPDGQSLAFSTLGDDATIFIHDFTPEVGQPALRVLTDDYFVIPVRFDDTGDNVLFVGYPKGTSPVHTLYRISTASTDGVATPLFAMQSSTAFDVTRPPASANSRIVADSSGTLKLWKLDGNPDRSLTEGYLAHFNCNNTAIIHRGTARRRPTLITTLASPLAPTTWSSDSNIHHTDWLQRSPCTA